ncbi:MAG: ABC-2 transporter permease [Blastocatellia bacterium]
MARVRQILKYQWKAYWRRFMRPGQLAQFDMLLLLLLGALLIFKLPPVLRRAARELAIGQTAVMDQLLFALAAAWLYPRIENAIISIHPKDLIRFPLTINSLLLVRIGSFFISPVAMIITAGSLLGALPFLASPRPFIGIAAAILFFVMAASLGLSLSHMMSSAALRIRLMIVAAIVIVPLGSVLFASGREAGRRLASIVQFTPMRLVTIAAIAPNYRMALLSLMTLTGCAALALLLLRWSFSRNLSDQETNTWADTQVCPYTKRIASLIRFPGRLGGLVRKEQNYFRKQPIVWIGLLIALAYSQTFWFGAPHPATFQAIILIVFSINMTLSANSFGLDEPQEINRYLLFPLRGRDILLGKNLGFAIIVGLQLSVTLPFAFWRLGWHEVSFGLIEAAALSLAYMAWGNLDSVSAPYKMIFYRETGGGSLIDAIIGMTLCSLPGIAIIYLTRFNSELLAAKIISILALTTLAYLGSLHFAGKKFERDWQKISYRLS